MRGGVEHGLEGSGRLTDLLLYRQQFDHILDLDPLAAFEILDAQGQGHGLVGEARRGPEQAAATGDLVAGVELGVVELVFADPLLLVGGQVGPHIEGEDHLAHHA